VRRRSPAAAGRVGRRSRATLPVLLCFSATPQPVRPLASRAQPERSRRRDNCFARKPIPRTRLPPPGARP
jgi:hypothetical protein